MSLLTIADPHAELASMADELVASGNYRVLRRLCRRPSMQPHDGTPTRRGLLIDVETTGLDPTKDEVIEIALVPFIYGLDGRIFEVGEPFDALQEPTVAIPPAVTSLTGITAAMVAGKNIDLDVVSAMAKAADLVVAHNAAFDRKFVERLCGTFGEKPWACSMSEVDWKKEGYEGAKLAYLAMGAGFYYDKHRAANDCLAAIELLATSLPSTGKPAMERLLDRARMTTWRIWAENAPFAGKDDLKCRGYRWNADAADGPRSWYIDVLDAEKPAHVHFLRTDVYGRDVELRIQRLTAYERFSSRHTA